jgi:hypothetical protein
MSRVGGENVRRVRGYRDVLDDGVTTCSFSSYKSEQFCFLRLAKIFPVALYPGHRDHGICPIVSFSDNARDFGADLSMEQYHEIVFRLCSRCTQPT